jgi:hypothetical protein
VHHILEKIIEFPNIIDVTLSFPNNSRVLVNFMTNSNISRMVNVRSLKLPNFTVVYPDVPAYMNEFGQLHNLEKLEIGGNSINPTGPVVLLPNVKEFTWNFDNINFSDNFNHGALTPIYIDSVFNQIKGIPQLEKLYINHIVGGHPGLNKPTENYFIDCLIQLSDSLVNLKRIELSSDGISIDGWVKLLTKATIPVYVGSKSATKFRIYTAEYGPPKYELFKVGKLLEPLLGFFNKGKFL